MGRSTVEERGQTSPTPAQVRRSRPEYAVLRGVSALVAVLMIGGSSLSLVPGMAQQEATSVIGLESAALGTLEQTQAVLVEGDRGDIVVRETSEGETPTVTMTSQWSFREPQLTMGESPEGQLLVSAPCPTGNWGTCTVDLELSVPAGTAVQVHTPSVTSTSSRPVTSPSSAAWVTSR